MRPDSQSVSFVITLVIGALLTLSQGCSDRIVNNDNARAIEMPDREIILEFKKLKGEELRIKHGAHSMGIGRQRIDGVKTDNMALLFYVTSSSDAALPPIPEFFEFTRESDGASFSIPTTVIETPQPQEEKL